MYKLTHHDCEELFIKQIGRLLKIRCKKCVTYIRANNAHLVYTLHNLSIRYEYNPVEDTMDLDGTAQNNGECTV
jgi:hypothetical protein